jgi:hypothetical protein
MNVPWRRLLPWALLAGAVVAAFTVLRRTPASPAEPVGSRPDTPGQTPPPDAGPMTAAEWRDFHVHLAHEQCEEGARRLNRLEGRAETDPQVLTRLSVCLRIGNQAWYKCMLRAVTASDAHACGQRFLSLDNPPW